MGCCKNVRDWFQRNRADRQFPPLWGKWAPGGPISVYLDHTLSPAQRDSMVTAVHWWERRFGPVFSLTSVLPPVRVVVVTQEPPLVPPSITSNPSSVEASADADTSSISGYLMRIHVRMGKDIEPERLPIVSTHELGHGLGLGDNIGGDPNLLMTRGSTGWELLPKEKKHVQSLVGR